jgi:hypothetical protein
MGFPGTSPQKIKDVDIYKYLLKDNLADISVYLRPLLDSLLSHPYIFLAKRIVHCICYPFLYSL